MLLYQHLRTGEAPSVEVARKFIEKMFFSTKKYDLGSVGRYRINKKFDLQASIDEPVLTKSDFFNGDGNQEASFWPNSATTSGIIPENMCSAFLPASSTAATIAG